MPYICFKNVSFSYKKGKNKIDVFHDLNIDFLSNKINIILGQSGCGKTTLLKCIAGFNDYSGTILFDENDVRALSTQERNIGYMNQSFAMYPHMTLFDSIAFPLKVMGVGINEIREKVYDIATRFDIAELLSRKPKQVSIGQLQRAALARAIIKNPTICLFDEPLSNLDDTNRTNFRRFLKEYLSSTITTVVYVTHSLEEATALGDYIHVMDNDGSFIFSGTSHELINSKDPKIMDLLSTIIKEEK